MAKAAFKCSKCDRTFSMKAHLARHMNTIHASGKRRKAAAKKRTAAKRVLRARAPAMAARRAPAAAGARVLGEIRAYHAELMAQRGAIDQQIGAIETAMSAMGAAQPKRIGRPKGRPAVQARGRAGRAGSLKDSIVNVLKKRKTPMSPRELSTAVVKAGYKTKAKDLTKAISNILPQIKKVKKVGRGMYRA